MSQTTTGSGSSNIVVDVEMQTTDGWISPNIKPPKGQKVLVAVELDETSVDRGEDPVVAIFMGKWEEESHEENDPNYLPEVKKITVRSSCWQISGLNLWTEEDIWGWKPLPVPPRMRL